MVRIIMKKSIADLLWGLASIGVGIYFVICWKIFANEIAKHAMEYGKSQEIAIHACFTIIGIACIIGGSVLIYRYFI